MNRNEIKMNGVQNCVLRGLETILGNSSRRTWLRSAPFHGLPLHQPGRTMQVCLRWTEERYRAFLVRFRAQYCPSWQ